MIKGSELQNRQGAGDDETLKAQLDAAQIVLRQMRAAIDRARVTKDGETNHCADCFRRGRDAALRIIDGG